MCASILRLSPPFSNTLFASNKTSKSASKSMAASAPAYQKLLSVGTKIIAVGRNYAAHAKELGNAVPKEPVLFLKPTSSYLENGGKIEVPEPLESLDHEVELAVIIGKRGRDVPEATAMDYIGGYALALDMTAREIQSTAKSAGLPWSVAKGQDTFTPISSILPNSMLPDPHNVELWLNVDGEVRQRGSTGDMIFKIPFLISHISSIFTLLEDDLLLFSRGDVRSLRLVMKAFHKISEASGLLANQLKSCIYFGGVKIEIQDAMLRESGMTKGELPFRYLGVPLSSNKLYIIHYQPLIKRILSRIDCWSSKLLSYAGRLQLIQSVLTSIQSYWSQVLLLPQKVLKVIQSACKTFLWTWKSDFFKKALMAWEHLNLPKTAGGWNIICAQVWNKAALFKLLWKINQKQDTLWVKWIHAYYIKNQSLCTMIIPTQASWIIRKILNARQYTTSIPNGMQFLTQTQYSTRKLYLALRGHFQKVEWHKMISQNGAPPKCLFITWLAILNRLATCDRLGKFGVVCDQRCILCCREDETIQHLFFSCDFSSHVWKELTSWCGIQGTVRSWDQVGIQCHSKTGEQKMYRMVVAVAVYNIWKERNLRKFQSRINVVESVIHQSKYMIATRCMREPKLSRMLKN